MRRVLLGLLLFSSLLLIGQEIYTIDNSGMGDYENFNTAIVYLNGLAELPEGGIIFNVISGQEFNETPGMITALGTETAPVIFQKSGEGQNPLINSIENIESMLHFNGAAWITFDGIDITDPISEDELRFEKGIYIFASNHISVKNCRISNFDNYGIHVRDISTNTILDNNEVFYTADYYTSMASVYGIYVQFQTGADNAIICNNKVYGLKEASATIYGIRVWKVTSQVYNNFVALPDDNNDKIYALRMDGGLIGLVMDVQYNTVYLGGAATDHGYCFYRTGTDGLMNVQNNIFINNRSGAFDHLIYDYTFVSGEWNADYNAYYAENGRFGDWGNTVCNTLEDWQTATAGDANSVYKNVEFLNGNDLHLAGSSLGDFDLVGMPLASITTDIDGDLRSEEYPYMGADEAVDYPLGVAQHTYGDVDDNGVIDSYDASLVMQYVVELDPAPAAPLPWEDWRITVADVDGNELIGAYDAALILQYIVEIIDIFPVEMFRDAVQPHGVIDFTVKDGELLLSASGEVYAFSMQIENAGEYLAQPELKNWQVLNALNWSEYKFACASAVPITGEFLSIPLSGEAENARISYYVNGVFQTQAFDLNPVMNGIPQVTSLLQNVPNPFNPETSISFTISDEEGGILSIFNIRGQLITENYFPAGEHTYHWNSTQYGSGIYFYQLSAGNQKILRKMTLLK
ncbi:MAG: T9SS type A sorting domain-containing protein [Candidatus Cloacimonetes bacterium]|nr:T9SS type A sorting domain-containing protein [Candidatus Cloacimonadota bacterium]